MRLKVFTNSAIAFQVHYYLKITSQFGLQEDSYSLSKYANENTYAMRKEKLFTEYQGADGVKKSFLPDGGLRSLFTW